MDNDEIQLMIRDEFQRGSDREEAFKNIFRRRGLNSLPTSTVSDWFKRICDSDILLEDEIGAFHYRLLYSIVGQYSKFKNAIFYNTKLQFKLDSLVNDRFVFAAHGDLNSLAIIDAFNDSAKWV